MGAFMVTWRFSRVEWSGRVTALPRVALALNVVIVLIGTLVGWRVLSGATRIAIGPVQIGMQTLYTPPPDLPAGRRASSLAAAYRRSPAP